MCKLHENVCGSINENVYKTNKVSKSIKWKDVQSQICIQFILSEKENAFLFCYSPVNNIFLLFYTMHSNVNNTETINRYKTHNSKQHFNSFNLKNKTFLYQESKKVLYKNCFIS